MSQGSDFDRLSDEQAVRLLGLLREPTLRHWGRFWEPRPRDPELRKLLGRVHSAIRDAQRLVAEKAPEFDDTAKARACDFSRSSRARSAWTPRSR